jgi:hypothetical protein
MLAIATCMETSIITFENDFMAGPMMEGMITYIAACFTQSGGANYLPPQPFSNWALFYFLNESESMSTL